MKHGKKPTREQRKLMEAWHLNSADWYVVKDTPDEMHITHRYVNKQKIIPKG